MTELLAQLIAEFRGAYPEVPVADGVDLEGIKSDDPEPMFVTLPLVKVGGQSRNGFTWDEPGVKRVVEEINAKRPEGNLGHVKPEDRAHEYSLPKLRWLGAALIDGTAYGKAYIPKYAGEVREYFRVAKRTNARVGTSVYGLRGARGLADLTLESIDLGHPDRLGSPDAAAVPRLTSEMEHEEGQPVGENNNNDALLSELRSDRDTARQQVAELQQNLQQRDARIAELEQAQTTLGALISEMSLGEQPVEAAKALVSELAGLRAAKLTREIDDVIVAEVANEALRPYIRRLIGSAASAAEAKQQIAELLGQDDIKALATALIVELRGPGAFVPGQKPGDRRKEIEDTPEARAAARSEFNF